ncbi:MAG: response regulator [Thermoplasmatales archaeon]|nr:MAG: response regulator [Thermoplasmatales archaeon]
MVKKILIVDDDPGVNYTVKNGLEGVNADYKVDSVDSGEKCLKFLGNNKIPDLILLDIMMPEMSGWETYNKIKENLSWKDIPVVFLTARRDRIAREAGGFFGDDYIEKPFTIPELKQRIERILKM